LLLKT